MLRDFHKTQAGNNSKRFRNKCIFEMAVDTYSLNTTLCWFFYSSDAHFDGDEYFTKNANLG